MILARYGIGESLMRTHNETHVGTVAWATIMGFVLAWDLSQEESMTHAFQRGMEHPIYKYLLIGALGTTAMHLTGILPEEVDPFYRLKLERGES